MSRSVCKTRGELERITYKINRLKDKYRNQNFCIDSQSEGPLASVSKKSKKTSRRANHAKLSIVEEEDENVNQKENYDSLSQRKVMTCRDQNLAPLADRQEPMSVRKQRIATDHPLFSNRTIAASQCSEKKSNRSNANLCRKELFTDEDQIASKLRIDEESLIIKILEQISKIFPDQSSNPPQTNRINIDRQYENCLIEINEIYCQIQKNEANWKQTLELQEQQDKTLAEMSAKLGKIEDDNKIILNQHRYGNMKNCCNEVRQSDLSHEICEAMENLSNRTKQLETESKVFQEKLKNMDAEFTAQQQFITHLSTRNTETDLVHLIEQNNEDTTKSIQNLQTKMTKDIKKMQLRLKQHDKQLLSLQQIYGVLSSNMQSLRHTEIADLRGQLEEFSSLTVKTLHSHQSKIEKQLCKNRDIVNTQVKKLSGLSQNLNHTLQAKIKQLQADFNDSLKLLYDDIEAKINWKIQGFIDDERLIDKFRNLSNFSENSLQTQHSHQSVIETKKPSQCQNLTQLNEQKTQTNPQNQQTNQKVQQLISQLKQQIYTQFDRLSELLERTVQEIQYKIEKLQNNFTYVCDRISGIEFDNANLKDSLTGLKTESQTLSLQKSATSNELLALQPSCSQKAPRDGLLNLLGKYSQFLE